MGEGSLSLPSLHHFDSFPLLFSPQFVIQEEHGFPATRKASRLALLTTGTRQKFKVFYIEVEREAKEEKKKARKGSTGGACFILVDHVSVPVGFRANCVARYPYSAARPSSPLNLRQGKEGEKKLSDPAIVMEKWLKRNYDLCRFFSFFCFYFFCFFSLPSSHPFSDLPA